jgi:hypothetical protein
MMSYRTSVLVDGDGSTSTRALPRRGSAPIQLGCTISGASNDGIPWGGEHGAGAEDLVGVGGVEMTSAVHNGLPDPRHR